MLEEREEQLEFGSGKERGGRVCDFCCKQRGRLAHWLECGHVGPPTRSDMGVSREQDLLKSNTGIGVRNDQSQYKNCFQAPKHCRSLLMASYETQTTFKQSSRLQRSAEQRIVWSTNMFALLQCFRLTLRTPKFGGCDILWAEKCK